ncbi:Hypothetical protein I5071_72920 [Sandaracinus amylolyticus]|nr:Hypothetical protein I5071_72920 [Sandaracinus amylolyticus]
MGGSRDRAPARSSSLVGVTAAARSRDAPFVVPDLEAPIDLESRLARCPVAEVKGLFFEPIAERTRRIGKPVGRARYLAFRGYPLTEWLAFLAAASHALYPTLPPREGLRRVGWGAYDGFVQSTVGAVLFGLAGKSPELAVPLVGRAYELVRAHGVVRILEHGPGRAVFSYRDFWDWPDAWHLGVLEGALRVFRLRGDVRVRVHGERDADLELRWR